VDDLVRAARIETLVEECLANAGAPGATIALTVEGESWTAGIGARDAARTMPLPADSRFGAYSITKAIVATIVMRLVEEKALALDAPFQEYLPDIVVDTPVSLRQLLNHTGGLPDYGGLAAYHAGVRDHPGAPWSNADFLAHTLPGGLLFMPGHGWRYSNIGYLLLRLILEEETGLPFAQVVRHYLALPCGLEGIAVASTLDDMASLTPGYVDTCDGLVNVIPGYHPGWVAHGLVTATATDLARFLDLLFAAAFFDDDTPLQEMLVGAPVAERHPWMEKPSYGLGLMIDPGNRHGVVAGHTGGGPGYSTAAYRFPNVAGKQVTVVALVNRSGGDTATDIVFSLANRLAETIGRS
jgi:D-alanyl-D-alanine carboxypeptidase